MTSKAVRDRLSAFFAEVGAIGGKTTGKTKRRGSSDYYKALSAKAVKARSKK
jgi:hypothetical protein